MGQRRRVSYYRIVGFARRHPDLLQDDIGRHFGLTQSQISKILRAGGLLKGKRYVGRPLVRQSGWSDKQFEWEQRLHDLNLGMDRGARLNNQRIFYAYDPLKEANGDRSATT